MTIVRTEIGKKRIPYNESRSNGYSRIKSLKLALRPSMTVRAIGMTENFSVSAYNPVTNRHVEIRAIEPDIVEYAERKGFVGQGVEVTVYNISNEETPVLKTKKGRNGIYILFVKPRPPRETKILESV